MQPDATGLPAHLRRIALLMLVLPAGLQYIYVDAMLQVHRIHSVVVFVLGG